MRYGIFPQGEQEGGRGLREGEQHQALLGLCQDRAEHQLALLGPGQCHLRTQEEQRQTADGDGQGQKPSHQNLRSGRRQGKGQEEEEGLLLINTNNFIV